MVGGSYDPNRPVARPGSYRPPTPKTPVGGGDFAYRNRPVVAVRSTDPRKQNPYRPGAVDPRKRNNAERARGMANPTSFNPEGAVSDLLADIMADYDAQLAEVGRGYGGGGGGGGGADYSGAIQEAEDMLADVVANRAALQGIYGEYGLITDPEEAAAIKAASEIVALNQGNLDINAENERTGIQRSYDQAEAVIAEMANLIGAGAGTTRSVQEEAVETEALALAEAAHEATAARELLALTQTASVDQAKADKALDEGDFERRAKLVDMEFEQMEDQIKDQIKALREAAAQAAAAARARRSAAASARAEAMGLLEDERFAALQIGPHEAGVATMISYLGKNGSNLPYARQQFVLSTVENAISTQVRPTEVQRWLRESGMRANPAEVSLIQGGIRAYSAGTAYQAERDKKFSITDPIKNKNPYEPRGNVSMQPKTRAGARVS